MDSRQTSLAPSSDRSAETPDARVPTATLHAVAEAVERLRYGTVQLTVHDGRVVQLDVTERQRFT